MKMPLLIGISVLAVLAIVAAALLYTEANSPDSPQMQACTLEARLCPDGSAVGRTGPNCSFAPCPGEETSE